MELPHLMVLQPQGLFQQPQADLDDTHRPFRVLHENFL